MLSKKVENAIMPIIEKLNLIKNSKENLIKEYINFSFENWIEILNLIENESIKSELAYLICLNFFRSKKDILIKFVTDDLFIYLWALNIGDREVLREKIKSSDISYFWGKDIGDRDLMIKNLTDEDDIFEWALNIGDREILREKIKSNRISYFWGKVIGDRDLMIKNINEEKYIQLWIKNIGNRDYFKQQNLIQ